MRRRYEQLRQSEAGFTLIELLIVIVILGVLAAIVVFSVRGINNNSNSAACSSDKATVDSALEAYFAVNRNYPAELALLWTGNNPLLKSEPKFGDTSYTYDAQNGTITVTC